MRIGIGAAGVTGATGPVVDGAAGTSRNPAHGGGKEFSMSTRSTLPGRDMSFVSPASLREPQIKQAVAKADENATRARSAKTAQDHEFYERMSRKWLDVAEHWRVIVDA